MKFISCKVATHGDKGPYYESKLELKSNSSEILPVNCKSICICTFIFWAESQI